MESKNNRWTNDTLHTYGSAAIIIVVPVVLVAVETQLNRFIGESVV
jgi:hypothetical protein